VAAWSLGNSRRSRSRVTRIAGPVTPYPYPYPARRAGRVNSPWRAGHPSARDGGGRDFRTRLGGPTALRSPLAGRSPVLASAGWPGFRTRTGHPERPIGCVRRNTLQKREGVPPKHSYHTRVAGHQHRSPWPPNTAHTRPPRGQPIVQDHKKRRSARAGRQPSRPSIHRSSTTHCVKRCSGPTLVVAVWGNLMTGHAAGRPFLVWGRRSDVTHCVKRCSGPTLVAAAWGNPTTDHAAGRHDRCPSANRDQVRRPLRTGLHPAGLAAV